MAEDFGTITVSESCEYLREYLPGAPWLLQPKCDRPGLAAYVVIRLDHRPCSYTFCCDHGDDLADDLMGNGFDLLGIVPARCDCDDDPHGPTIHLNPPGG